jgi:hypothetical protein
VPRYIAKRPIHIGGALAFAAGHQVPAGHVERFNLLAVGTDGPAVVEVGDDVIGDRPDLADALPDNTPPTVSVGHRLLYGDPVATDAEPEATPAVASKTRDKPAAGSTTSTVQEG